MKNKLLFTLALSLFALSYAACNRCHDQYFYLTQSQKDFANFKKGSYWIMRDSATGLLDSLVLNGDTSTGQVAYNGKCSDISDYAIQSISAFRQNVIIDSVFLGFVRSGQQGTYLVFDFITSSFRQGSNYVDVITSLPNQGDDLTLNGIVYHNVHVSYRHFVSVPPLHNFWTDLKLYYSNEYKLLKIAYHDPLDVYVWELVRANIIQ